MMVDTRYVLLKNDKDDKIPGGRGGWAGAELTSVVCPYRCERRTSSQY